MCKSDLEAQLNNYIENRLREELEKYANKNKMLGRLEVILFIGLTLILTPLFCWLYISM